MKQSTARKVERLLKHRFILAQSLVRGYANVSAVSRKIREETGGSQEAVRAAVNRLMDRQAKTSLGTERRVRDILRTSTLELEMKICVLHLERTAQAEEKAAGVAPRVTAYVRGPSGIMLAFKEKDRESVESVFSPQDVFDRQDDLVALVLSSPKNVESVPGVVAFLTTELAVEGINLLEHGSAFTDTIFLVEKKDSARAYQVLSDIIG